MTTPEIVPCENIIDRACSHPQCLEIGTHWTVLRGGGRNGKDRWLMACPKHLAAFAAKHGLIIPQEQP